MRLAAVAVMVVALAVRADPKQSCEAVRKTARFTVYFERVELEKLVQTVSDATCKTFILGDNVKGKISIVGPENGRLSLDGDQFYAAFLAALDVNGLTVYPSGRFLRIVEKQHARQAPLPLLVEGAPFPAKDEMVTRVFKLKALELEPVKALLGPMVSPGADLVGFAPDVLIVTDQVANLQRLETLLTALDVPKASTEVLRAIEVQHAEALDVADKVTRLLAAKGQGKSGADTLAIATDERTNRLLVVANPAVLDKVLELVATLDVPMTLDGRTRVYRLKNADAKEVAATLEAVKGPGKARGGGPAGAPGSTGEVRITANESLNALVITASAGEYKSLVEVIEQLDAPTRQVFIETVIMEVNLDRELRLGLSAHSLAQAGDSAMVFGSQPQGAPSSLGLKSLVGLPGLLAGVQGPILTQVSKVLGVDVPQFGIVLQAMQLSSDVNVLSTPHLLTTDNKEAEISVGQKVPFQQGYNPQLLQQLAASGNASTASTLSTYGGNVTREKVELKLTVKPHLGDGDTVRLDLNQQTEEIAGENSLGPITSTRGQKTSIVAHDEETVVLGGIMQDRVIESASKTPLLGDLPILGHLFRYTDRKKTKVNLLVFLTPHVIRDPSDFRRLLDRKLAERKKLAEQFYGEVADAHDGIDFGRKPGPLAAIQRALLRELARPEHGGAGGDDERVISPEPH